MKYQCYKIEAMSLKIQYKIEVKINVEPSHRDWIASSDFQGTGGEIDG